ncbi:MAG: S41 family peptidase [Acidobacteriaceae bacterium]
MSSRVRRTAFALVVFFAACGLAGMFISQKVGAQSATDESAFRDSLKEFTSVYQVVAQNYAEPLNGHKPDQVIYDGAIPEMLRTLDPHSNFYDPDAYAKMQEDESGKYYGVGMVIQAQNNKVIVVYPFEGSPSYKAGLRPADVILTVDGKSTHGMDTSAVANLLKGPKGTHVKLTVSREGASAPLTFDLVRQEIPHPSIDLKYEIKPGILYIHITQFQQTTSREFADTLDEFPNIKGLVLDLRGNPGGVLVDAVAVCDKLLNRGQIIVSQRGRAYPEQVYRATHGNYGHFFPIVVLVNHNTASAAEIVSGALQDHDRALIVGQVTFGKGLVQTVYPLSDNTGLALTTYHYYTPSGRLIQRNYNGVSLYDYYYNHEPDKDLKNREVRLTDSGRTVYGGGGINPDDTIDPPKANHFQEVLDAHNVFFNFAPYYLAHHTAAKDFEVNKEVIDQFKQFLTQQNIAFTDQDLDGIMDWLKMNIKSNLVASQESYRAGLRVRANWDPMIAKALTFLPQAATLEETAQKIDKEKQTTASNAAPAPAQ